MVQSDEPLPREEAMHRRNEVEALEEEAETLEEIKEEQMSAKPAKAKKKAKK